MTRETKIGLLVGMGVIILIGILISDHLSEAQRQEYAGLDERSIPELEAADLPAPPPNHSSRGDDSTVLERSEPLKMPEELAYQEDRPAEPEPPRPAEPDDASDDAPPAPFYLRQDFPPVTFRADVIEERPADPQPQARPTTEVRIGPSAEELGGQWVDVPDINATRSAGAEEITLAADRVEESQEQAPDHIYHHVREGETLSDIARRYYDDPNYWRRIQEANRDIVPDVNRLRPGVRLVIPNKAGRANTAADTQPTATEEYTIQSGESLSALAGRYYGSVHEWRKLYELNEDRISDPDRLKPGTVIRVPRD